MDGANLDSYDFPCRTEELFLYLDFVFNLGHLSVRDNRPTLTSLWVNLIRNAIENAYNRVGKLVRLHGRAL